MKTLAIKFIEKQIPYTGKELRSHFIYSQLQGLASPPPSAKPLEPPPHRAGGASWIDCDLLGDALVSFVGPCEVSLDHMVDLEDVKLKSPIYSENMLHFLGEFYGISLETTVLYQRLLMALMLEELQLRGLHKVFRSGDDLYEGEAKLSVSIATVSPTSTLIHAGINISSKNTPVKTKGLDDLKISAPEFSQSILKKFQEEFQDISKAICKVRSVL